MSSFPKKPVAVITLAFGFFILSANAARHPVPLDPNTDSAKCITCHEDKTKGASVHSANAQGCMSCHEIRIIKSRDKKKEDITRVKLIKATPLSLCLTCHQGMKASGSSSVVHAPVTRNCLTCHDPHNSPNKNLLKKVASGDSKENLCLSCHNQGLNVPEKGSRHAALDMGCDTCHVTHKTGNSAQRDNRFHLTKDAPALCLDCHDATDKKLAEAHHNQPFATADCLTCHDPHQSPKPKLAQRFQHAPFEAGSCEACHADAKDGKVVLTQTDVRGLCVTCHEEQAKQIETAKVQHPGAQGECTACHSPHASKYPRLLAPDPVTICENCHSEEAEMHKHSPALHAAAFRDGCFTCHNGHGGDRPNLLRATMDGNKLCLECHSPRRRPGFDKATQMVTIFDGTVELPADYFVRMPPLNLQNMDTTGHPTASHPVVAAVDRGDPDKKRPMTCLSCHLPHAGVSSGLFVSNTATTMPLCGRCHHGEVGGVPDVEAQSAPTPAQTPKGKGKGKKN
ncbi:MAG: cytochrome c3 family protein [Candidatus Korobacteraceae bacterium]